MSSTTPPPSHFSLTLHNIGLGYAIALAFGFLVLLSALLLSSYLCCRNRQNHNNTTSHHHRRHHRRHPSDSNTIIVPRIFFVAEDDDNDTDLENSNSGTSNGVVGLDRAVINSYPKFHFYKKNLESYTASMTDNLMVCSICLCDYKDGEMLRMMPDCKHFFHLTCLDAWLKLNGSCPVCRNSPLPTPVSTPLAEVVPLSLYPDNRRTSSVISSSS